MRRPRSIPRKHGGFGVSGGGMATRIATRALRADALRAPERASVAARRRWARGRIGRVGKGGDPRLLGGRSTLTSPQAVALAVRAVPVAPRRVPVRQRQFRQIAIAVAWAATEIRIDVCSVGFQVAAHADATAHIPAAAAAGGGVRTSGHADGCDQRRDHADDDPATYRSAQRGESFP